MRKLLCILLAVSCLFFLDGCKQKDAAPKDSIPVYYKKAIPDYTSEEGIIGKAYLDISGCDDEVSAFLEAYLAATPGEDFAPTFPEEVSIKRFQVEALTAKIVLTSQMANLTGMDLTIALTCLAKTALSLTDCQEVIISAEDALLHGEKFVTLTADSFLSVDNSGQTQD